MLRAGNEDGGHKMSQSLKEIPILVRGENGHHNLVNVFEISSQLPNSKVLLDIGAGEHVVRLCDKNKASSNRQTSITLH